MKQGRLINFELHWDTIEDPNDILPSILEKDFKDAADNGITCVIGTFLLEGLLPHDTNESRDQELFSKIKNLANKYNLEVILLSGLGEKLKRIKIPFEILYTSYHLRISFNILPSIQHTIAKVPNDKFLFLGGVPTRMNRIWLLSKLYDSNMLQKGEWSFFVPVSQEDQDYCRNLLSHYSDDEYAAFLQACTRSVDEKYKKVIKYFRDYAAYKESDFEEWSKIIHTSWWKNPVFIDPEIYNRTCLSIISEGENCWTDDYNFITEKVWRAIIYKHPFLFAGHPEQFNYIKQLGFETFEKYMLIENYAIVEDQKERLEYIVDNVEYFLKNRFAYEKQIQQDIEHNFALFSKLAHNQDLFLQSLQIEYNIDNAEFIKFFDTAGFENLIRPISDARALLPRIEQSTVSGNK